MKVRRVLLPGRRVRTGALATASSAAAEPARVGFPSSIALRGLDHPRLQHVLVPYIDCVSNSWSTGSSTTVNGHYRRILAGNAAISGRTFNDAVTGADMADFVGQAQRAVTQGAQYVTVMLGANDACASSEAAMTPTATFRAQFAQGLQTLSAGLPTASIFVASVPTYAGSGPCGRTASLRGPCGPSPGSASRCSRTRDRPRPPTRHAASVSASV